MKKKKKKKLKKNLKDKVIKMELKERIKEINDFESYEMTISDVKLGIIGYMYKKGFELEKNDPFYNEEERKGKSGNYFDESSLEYNIRNTGLVEFQSILGNLSDEKKIEFIEDSAESIGYHLNDKYIISEFASILEFAGEEEYNKKILEISKKMEKEIEKDTTILKNLPTSFVPFIGTTNHISDIEKLVELKQIDNPYTEILEKKDELLKDLTRETIDKGKTEIKDIVENIKDILEKENYDSERLKMLDFKIENTVKQVIKEEYPKLEKEKNDKEPEMEY
jgi:hypothetical protein